MKTKWLCVVTGLSLALGVVACSNSDDSNGDSSGGKGGKASGGSGGKGGAGGKGGSGGTSNGGSGGKASGGSGGSASGGSGGSASGGSGGSASGGSGGSASGGSGGSASGGSGGSASGGSGGSASGGSGGSASGGSGGSASGGAGGTTGNNGDTAEWNFEQQLQLWKALRGADAPKTSTTTVLKGLQSLELPINVTSEEIAAALPEAVERAVGLSNPGIMSVAGVPSWSGKTVAFNVWVPTNFPDGYFTAFVNGMSNPWKDSGFTGLNKGGWTAINLAAPAVSNAGRLDSFLELGLYFKGFTAPWTGSIFVDSVEIK